MDFYPLNEAAVSGDSKAVQFLIKAGVPLDEIDEQGHSPLHWAVFRGDAVIVQLLLEAGADPNSYAKDGVTPTWRARDFGLLEIEQLLTQYGGRIATNEDFDANAFQLFAALIGQAVPKEEKLQQSKAAGGLLQRLRWWKRAGE